ncbi:GntR family transcriptional regulator [Arthrobacter sp.]|uniref:GntR family transcriptional regulator n=1 Tax=Arthrobacter sp. TaxID=1667 RepID=UPI00289DCAE4|nr:GntR family transcriptional regulator [Arthrobacter sp.]
MNPDVHAFLSQTLTPSLGVPLRVAVYSRLTDGIRSNIFPLGSLLPRETELGAAIGLSRTVVREALMLLEEDGLIVTRRGVGRFVAETLPGVGLEEFRPFETALADQGRPLKVVPGEMKIQPSIDYINKGLSLDAEANGEPIALVQEGLPAGKYLSDISSALAENLQKAAESEETLLAALIRLCGPVFTAGTCGISAGVAGAGRAKQLNLRAQDPVLILTQTAQHNGTLVYLAKCIVSPHLGQLNIVQTTPPS